MKYQYKKMAGVLKKRLIQLKKRGWIHDFQWFSNTCVTVWFTNPIQEKKTAKLRDALSQFGYEVKYYSNAINFNLLNKWNWHEYSNIAKLWLRRIVNP